MMPAQYLVAVTECKCDGLIYGDAYQKYVVSVPANDRASHMYVLGLVPLQVMLTGVISDFTPASLGPAPAVTQVVFRER
jgi:hypothetical protein